MGQERSTMFSLKRRGRRGHPFFIIPSSPEGLAGPWSDFQNGRVQRRGVNREALWDGFRHRNYLKPSTPLLSGQAAYWVDVSGLTLYLIH
jgi:hypothetical protein